MPSDVSARTILERLIGFPTVSRDSNLDLIEWVEDYLGGHGIRAQRVHSPCGSKAHLFAQTGPEAEGGVMLSGHSDVVPVDGQAWSTDPWAVTERAGRLYGRGTCDMKGFVALALAALPRARAAPLKRPLQLALSYDEEVGCIAVTSLIARMAEALPRPAAVIVGEPSMMQVVTGHKGGTGYDVHVRGHEVHSSLIHRGVSAVMQAARLVDWANRRNAQAAATSPGPAAAAFDPPWTTLHVGCIRGGTALNITARDCRFNIEIRVVPGESVAGWEDDFEAEVARIEAEMQAVHPDARIVLEKYFALPPLEPEAGGAAEALARRLTGDNGTHAVSFGTEGGQFQRHGLSTVICGPGDIAQAHQPDEYLSLAQFEAGGRFLDRLIDHLTE